MNSGFFLGRSTPQWLAVIGGTLSFIGILVSLFMPAAAVPYGIIAGGLVVLANFWLGFLTNTSTTPSFDPILKAGQGVTVTNAAGDIVSTVVLPTVKELNAAAKEIGAPMVAEDGEDGVA